MVSNSSAAHVSTKREDCRHIHQHTPTTDSEEEPPLKLIFISDIHVCVNDPISWYQSKIHEASVCAILDYATCEKQPAFDIVFLGDFVDTWTARVAIAPEELPSWARIRNANTFLFDKIAEAMDLIKGEMYFVNGNHDMHITREDIEGVVSSSGKKHMVFLESGEYTHSNGLIRATHGHVFSLLNSYDKTSPFNGIPVVSKRRTVMGSSNNKKYHFSCSLSLSLSLSLLSVSVSVSLSLLVFQQTIIK
eukprot:GEZU01010441.1.p1 GENE.GEZU01010441.1~~GEZU01010441.1.p1  ORF type:complete len:276 (-),score=38.34 GEZU01010441.1:64-807(-)